MKTKKAFTLIELLVVIAIIALLLSIILPALRRVKESAKSLFCQTNLKSLAAAVQAYAVNNDEALPGSWNYHPTFGWGHLWDWAWSPWDSLTDSPTYTGVGYDASLEEREEGIRRGSIWSYMESMDSYHCPSDKTVGGNFRSYSMPDSLNPTVPLGNWEAIPKISKIKSPGSKYVFLEDNDPRGYNINSWIIDTSAGKTSDEWGDPMALWHSSHSNLSFADGHSEEWNWSRETLGFFEELESFATGFRPTTAGGQEDLQRVLRAWPE